MLSLKTKFSVFTGTESLELINYPELQTQDRRLAAMWVEAICERMFLKIAV
jgi:hypothetical protein